MTPKLIKKCKSFPCNGVISSHSEEGLAIPSDIQHQYDIDIEFQTDEKELEVLTLVNEHFYDACPIHPKKLKGWFKNKTSGLSNTLSISPLISLQNGDDARAILMPKEEHANIAF